MPKVAATRMLSEISDFPAAAVYRRSAYPVPRTPQIDPSDILSHYRQTLRLSSAAFRTLVLAFFRHRYPPERVRPGWRSWILP